MNIKEDSFSDFLLKDSFFLLVKPEDNIYSNTSIRNSFFEELENLVKLGLMNIEISWSSNENWFDFVSDIKIKYPRINLGSASIVKSNDEEFYSDPKFVYHLDANFRQNLSNEREIDNYSTVLDLSCSP